MKLNIHRAMSKYCIKISFYLSLTAAVCAANVALAGTIDELNLSVAKSNAVLTSMHKKAKKAIVNAAQDNTFKDYFSSHDDDHKHELKQKIDNISLNVQDRFHVEEMCLIDPNGQEISRIVGSKIAHDLSDEEASADFFAPSFSQKARTAYQSPIYMSPDVDRWVVAYVTPVIAENEKRAILHYEHGLDIFQKAISKVANAKDQIQMVVTEKGWVIWHHENSIGVDKTSDTEDHAAYFEQFDFGGKNIEELVHAIDIGSDIIGDDGKRYLAAYQQVSDWYVLALKAATPETSALEEG